MSEKKAPLECMNDNVLILPDPLDEKVGSIIIPENMRDQYCTHRGTVAAIGPGRLDKNGQRIPIDNVEVGDRIIYHEYAMTWLDYEDKTYLGMKAESLLCKII